MIVSVVTSWQSYLLIYSFIHLFCFNGGLTQGLYAFSMWKLERNKEKKGAGGVLRKVKGDQ